MEEGLRDAFEGLVVRWGHHAVVDMSWDMESSDLVQDWAVVVAVVGCFDRDCVGKRARDCVEVDSWGWGPEAGAWGCFGAKDLPFWKKA